MQHTSEGSPLTPKQVRLRVCDGEGERILTASLPVLEQAFASAVIRSGTEISLSDGTRILVALALGSNDSDASGESEFLLSRIEGEHASLSGPVTRVEAVRQFHQFLAANPMNVQRDGRVIP